MLDNPAVLAGFGAAALLLALMFWKRGEGKTSGNVFLTSNAVTHRVKLISKTNLSHDTRLFRFALPSPSMTLGLPIGKHFTLYAKNFAGKVAGEWNGRADIEAEREKIERKYTPTSSDDDRGFFDLVVKVYAPNERFCDGGKMSQHLDKMTVGKDEIELRGPFGLIEYKGHGQFEYSRKQLPLKKHVGMLAGGTGITPMLQVINAILKDQKDETKISLLFANQTQDDILLREELESLAKEHPSRFKLWFTLDRPPVEWKYDSGFINEEMLRRHMPPPSDSTVILICGPPPMVKFACQDNLKKIGFGAEQMLVF